MPVILRIDDAHKAYADQVLLDAGSLTITDRMRVGLVGRNGAGKSTLVRCILGEEELDSGSIELMPGCSIAYLEQHDDFGAEETVAAWLERRSGEPDWRCGEVAGRFALGPAELAAPVKRLSGGWQTRVKLTAMLLADPDLLVLDEPTNFLDLRTQFLLERFLAGWRGAALVVSHDRPFLNATCTHTCELARGELTLRPGDLDAFDDWRAEKAERIARTNAALATKAKQLQRFIDSNRANANTASQARNKAKQLAKLEEQFEDGPEADRAALRFSVPQTGLTPGPVLRTGALAVGYRERVVARCEDLELERGTRTVVVGDNGQGKTTLLRTLAGDLLPVDGEPRWTHGATIGVYAQHVFGTLPEARTVVEFLTERAPPGTPGQDILAIAGGFLFQGEAVHKPIRVLSGGERARLVLAGLLLGGHTVLILDEPTNHLDVVSVEALARALHRWDGTVLVASHDRGFCRELASGVIEVGDGRIGHFPGSFELYEYRLRQELATEGEAAEAVAPHRDDAAERKARARRRYELEKTVKNLDRRLRKLQGERDRLDQRLANAHPSAAGALANERARVVGELAEVEEEWLAAAEELEAIAD